MTSQVALVTKNSPANAGDVRDSGSIPGSGRTPGGGHGNPLQYSYLDKAMKTGAWSTKVHRVAKSQTQLKKLSTHTHHILFIYSISGHVGYFHFLVPFITNFVMNMGVAA